MPETELVRAERELTRLGDLLDAEKDRYKEELLAYAEAESDAKLAEASAYVRFRNLGSTQRDAEMKARIEAQQELRASRIAEARTRATREALAVYEKRIDEKRTILVNMRPTI